MWKMHKPPRVSMKEVVRHDSDIALRILVFAKFLSGQQQDAAVHVTVAVILVAPPSLSAGESYSTREATTDL
jgi:hypothetical protein